MNGKVFLRVGFIFLTLALILTDFEVETENWNILCVRNQKQQVSGEYQMCDIFRNIRDFAC